MKKLILALLMFCAWAADAYADNGSYEVTRDRRRIAYRNVTECIDCEGRNTINCSGGGLIACRPLSVISIGENVLTGVQFDAIDLLVETKLLASNGKPSKFVYDGKFVVTYRYLEDSGKVNYTIYSIQDAIDLKIIPNIN